MIFSRKFKYAALNGNVGEMNIKEYGPLDTFSKEYKLIFRGQQLYVKFFFFFLKINDKELCEGSVRAWISRNFFIAL